MNARPRVLARRVPRLPRHHHRSRTRVVLMSWWMFAAGWFALVWVLGPLVGRFLAPERLKPDPAFDPGLREDEQVEALDALWALPTREPMR